MTPILEYISSRKTIRSFNAELDCDVAAVSSSAGTAVLPKRNRDVATGVLISMRVLTAVKHSVRMAEHQCRRKPAENVHAGSFPKYLARNCEQRKAGIGPSTNRVGIAIACGLYGLYHRCIEAPIGISKMMQIGRA